MNIFTRFWNWITGKKLRYFFPPEIEDEGRKALESAKLIVLRVEKLPKKIGGNLYLVACQGHVGGIPILHHPKWPGWPIAGYCTERRDGKTDIVVPVGVGWGTLVHEFCHAWLFAIGIYGHDQRLNAWVEGWLDSYNATGVSTDGRQAPPVPTYIDMVDDGTGLHTHIDFIAAPPVLAALPGGTTDA